MRPRCKWQMLKSQRRRNPTPHFDFKCLKEQIKVTMNIDMCDQNKCEQTPQLLNDKKLLSFNMNTHEDFVKYEYISLRLSKIILGNKRAK